MQIETHDIERVGARLVRVEQAMAELVGRLLEARTMDEVNIAAGVAAQVLEGVA